MSDRLEILIGEHYMASASISDERGERALQDTGLLG